MRRRVVPVVCLALVLTLLLAPAAFGGGIHGVVHRSDGSTRADEYQQVLEVKNGRAFRSAAIAYTRADGSFDAALPPGTYKLLVRGGGGYAQGLWTSGGLVPVDTMATTITVSAGATETIEATAPLAAAMSGTVVKDADGSAVATFTMTSYALDPGSGVWEPMIGMAGYDGTYSCTELLPGAYRVGFESADPRYLPRFWNGQPTIVSATTIDLDAGETTSTVSARLKVDIAVDEIAGASRLGTAIEISKRRYPEGSEASAVVIATAWNWPDALCGGPFAAAVNAPILLTDKASMPASLVAEVERLHALGAAKAYVLGSDDAVDFAVDDQLSLIFGQDNVERLAGLDRYGTSRAIATEVFSRTGARAAYIVTGKDYPDALAAAPQACQTGVPILFANIVAPGQPLWPGFYEYLDQHIDRAFIVGNDKAVSLVVENDLKSICGAGNVRRYEGDNRFETCLALIRSHYDLGRLFVANAYNYPDALAGGVLAAANEERILLVNPRSPLNGAVGAWLRSLGASATVERLTYLGSDKAVQPSARAAVLDAAD